MKSFLYCEECDRPYPVHEVGWAVRHLEDLEGPYGFEFKEGDEQRRAFCRKFHSCETLWVISDYVVGEEWDPLKKIIFIVVDKKGIPMIILRTRTTIKDAPVYKLYRPQNYKASLAIPDRLLYLVA